MSTTTDPAPLTVIALSGGMDSTVLAAHYIDAGHRIIAVSVDYGQRHARELHAAREVGWHYRDAFEAHHFVDLSALRPLLAGSALTDAAVGVPEGHYADESMRATVVPNRNAILANVLIGAAVAAGAQTVGLGVHAGDHAVYPDCRPQFIDTLNALAAVACEGFAPPTVQAPFVHISKTEIARRGHDLGAPFALTWSCYKGGSAHCGRCGTCVERAESFRDAGVADPTVYLGGTQPGLGAPAGVGA